MNIPVISFVFILFSRGIFGNNKTCSANTDCPSSKTCLKGFCQSPCVETCGSEALCVVMKHQAYCFCKDDSDDCLPRKVSRSCVPECEKNSECNTNIGYCECKTGFDGNPYKGCRQKCKTTSDCPFSEACIAGSCRNPCEEDCGPNSLCTIKNHIAVCTCPPDFTGDPYEICRNIDDSEDICKQCGLNSKCMTVANSKTCMCPRGFIGNPFKLCNKMCLSNNDCPADKNCDNHVCKNPCTDACGVNTHCSVDKYKRKPICKCQDGFSGDPSRICTIMLDSRYGGNDEDLNCHPKCGTNAFCDTKHGICHCNKDFIGNPYGNCRKKCMGDFDCPLNQACSERDCKNPCLIACGKNALCTVLNHTPICRCPYGFTGDPFVVCNEIVSTQTSIIDVDLCDTLTCGENAECSNAKESCSCLPGYAGNPNKICYKSCHTNSDCSKDKICKNGTCKNVCENKCGINAVCKARNHEGICSCQQNYKGDPLKICFPDSNDILQNPSRVPCLKCICKALTGNDDLFACAEKSISFTYWAFAGEDLVGGENFRTRNSTIDFITCMNNRICILNTMNDYISRVLHRLNDIDCDGEVTCADYFAAHKFGLTAKFSDSIFNISEARSFDQCENHGQKDVSDGWKPKKCVGPSYVEILS